MLQAYHKKRQLFSIETSVMEQQAKRNDNQQIEIWFFRKVVLQERCILPSGKGSQYCPYQKIIVYQYGNSAYFYNI